MTEQEKSPDDEKCWDAYVAYVKKPKPVRETPGSDHGREIEHLAFLAGWAAAKAASLTGPGGSND